jgi:hypothetical protein
MHDGRLTGTIITDLITTKDVSRDRTRFTNVADVANGKLIAAVRCLSDRFLVRWLQLSGNAFAGSQSAGPVPTVEKGKLPPEVQQRFELDTPFSATAATDRPLSVCD